MRAIMDYVSRSTLKREYAVLLTVWWAAVGTWLLSRSPLAATVPDAALQVWSGLAVPVLAIGAAAFGSDFVAKQTNWGGPPIDTETVVKTETTPDSQTTTTTMEQKP